MEKIRIFGLSKDKDFIFLTVEKSRNFSKWFKDFSYEAFGHDGYFP